MTIIERLFNEMGSIYTLGTDGMYFPDLEFPKEEIPRYGKMRHTHLREQKKACYIALLFDIKPTTHLKKINYSANTWMNPLIKQIANG